MKTVFDVPAQKLISAAAEKLKALPEMRPPQWVGFVKTGAHAERAPDSPDFWYVRAASLLRQVYVNGPVGVSVAFSWPVFPRAPNRRTFRSP